MDNKSKYTQLIKQKANELGFFYCGISQADFLADHAPRLENWLKNGYNGRMSYMENHFDKRLDPRLLVEGAKSVISLAFNYFPEKDLFENHPIKIAKYAYGEDYHFVIKDKLTELMNFIHENIGEVTGRCFVDSAPVLDKAWAEKSGMGWVGKHSLLLNKDRGSFFFISELIIDLDLNYDGAIKDYCGTCTQCIDDCPTDAIVAPQVVDASKCISYLTIELKDELLPDEFKNKMNNWAFGCDICQDVCPWNRFSTPHKEKRLLPSHEFQTLSNSDWTELTEEIFNEIFKRSAIKRTKFKGLERNITFIKQTKLE